MQNHPFVQIADFRRSGRREQEWKHAVYKTGEASANHAERKTEGSTKVLKIAFANGSGMFREGEA
jgi:hypothetical protein